MICLAGKLIKYKLPGHPSKCSKEKPYICQSRARKRDSSLEANWETTSMPIGQIRMHFMATKSIQWLNKMLTLCRQSAVGIRRVVGGGRGCCTSRLPTVENLMCNLLIHSARNKNWWQKHIYTHTGWRVGAGKCGKSGKSGEGVGRNFSFHCFVSWENTRRISPKQKAGKVAKSSSTSSRQKGEQRKTRENSFLCQRNSWKCLTELEANFCDIYLLCPGKKTCKKKPSWENCNKAKQTKQTEMKAKK